MLKLDKIDLDVLIDLLTDDKMRLRKKYKAVKEYLAFLSWSEAERE